MYDYEDITENMNEDNWVGQWVSVIHNMNCYRVVHNGRTALMTYDQEMNLLNDEEGDEIGNKVSEYLRSK